MSKRFIKWWNKISLKDSNLFSYSFYLHWSVHWFHRNHNVSKIPTIIYIHVTILSSSTNLVYTNCWKIPLSNLIFIQISNFSVHIFRTNIKYFEHYMRLLIMVGKVVQKLTKSVDFVLTNCKNWYQFTLFKKDIKYTFNGVQ